VTSVPILPPRPAAAAPAPGVVRGESSVSLEATRCGEGTAYGHDRHIDSSKNVYGPCLRPPAQCRMVTTRNPLAHEMDTLLRRFGQNSSIAPDRVPGPRLTADPHDELRPPSRVRRWR